MKDTLQMKYRKKYWVVVIFFLFICLSGCGGHKQQSASIDLSTLHKVKATDFDELSDELSFDFVDKTVTKQNMSRSWTLMSIICLNKLTMVRLRLVILVHTG